MPRGVLGNDSDFSSMSTLCLRTLPASRGMHPQGGNRQVAIRYESCVACVRMCTYVQQSQVTWTAVHLTSHKQPGHLADKSCLQFGQIYSLIRTNTF